MNNNLLFKICQYNSAKKMLATYQKTIMETICEAIRDVIPDIEWRLGNPENQNLMIFYSEDRAKKFSFDDEAYDNYWRFSSVIESVFPALEFSVGDNYLYVSPEERDEIIKRLKKLRGE